MKLPQDCFKSIDWDVIRSPATQQNYAVDLEEYAMVVISHTCVENAISTKCIRTYPDQKPWINCEVWPLLRAHCIHTMHHR